MAIRLANNCSNCENMLTDGMCTVHGVKVGANYSCDTFEMKASLKDERNCLTCVHHETDDCANPEKAAPGMLCAQWGPREVA